MIFLTFSQIVSYDIKGWTSFYTILKEKGVPEKIAEHYLFWEFGYTQSSQMPCLATQQDPACSESPFIQIIFEPSKILMLNKTTNEYCDLHQDFARPIIDDLCQLAQSLNNLSATPNPSIQNTR